MTGLALFAGSLMIVVGIFQAIRWLVALIRNEVYLVGIDYVASFEPRASGWIYLLVSIPLAILSMITIFGFLPCCSVWSLLIIAIAFFVIWALCSYDRAVAGR